MNIGKIMDRELVGDKELDIGIIADKLLAWMIVETQKTYPRKRLFFVKGEISTKIEALEGKSAWWSDIRDEIKFLLRTHHDDLYLGGPTSGQYFLTRNKLEAGDLAALLIGITEGCLNALEGEVRNAEQEQRVKELRDRIIDAGHNPDMLVEGRKLDMAKETEQKLLGKRLA